VSGDTAGDEGVLYRPHVHVNTSSRIDGDS
jgi:hypothetical protein